MGLDRGDARMDISKVLCDQSTSQSYQDLSRYTTMAKDQRRPLSPATTSFSSTPPTCANDGTCYVNEEQQQITNRLLTDKDRLLKEKDELVSSKHQAWQEHYQAVNDRDARIRQLELVNESLRLGNEQEINKHKERNTELLSALRQYMDRDAEAELNAEAAEDRPDQDLDESKEDHGVQESDYALSVVENKEDRESSPESFRFPDQETSSLFDAPHQVSLDDVAFGRQFSDDKPAAKRQKSSANRATDSAGIKTYFPPIKPDADQVIELRSSPSRSSSVELVGARPVKPEQRASLLSRPMRPGLSSFQASKAAVPNPNPNIAFTAVVDVSVTGEHKLGGIEDLSDIVQASLQSFLPTLLERRAAGKMSKAPPKMLVCGWMWMQNSVSSTQWTVKEPAKYACKTCFNSRRVCFKLNPDWKALVLPLPPSVRDVESTYNDEWYYLRAEDIGTSARRVGRRSQEEKGEEEADRRSQGLQAGE